MSIKEYKRIIKKIYSDFKKKYPEEYKRQMDINIGAVWVGVNNGGKSIKILA